MYCFMNGEYMPADELRISPFDHGFLYGLGFFETFRTYQGKPLFLELHYARLLQALTTYRITMPYTLSEVADIVAKLVEFEGGQDGYFRLNVSAGEHDIGLRPQFYDKPTVIMFVKPLRLAEPHTEKNLRWLTTIRNSPEQTERYKSHHYGNNVLARFEMPSLATEEGIFVNAAGHIVEGVTSNVFWVKDNKLYTPALKTGALNGITRQLIMSLMPTIEGEFTKQELEQADECFITNAVQELVPIKSLENTLFKGATGSVYQKLYTAYQQLLEERLC